MVLPDHRGSSSTQQPRLVNAMVNIQELIQYSNPGQCTQQPRYKYRRSHSTATQVSVHSSLGTCTGAHSTATQVSVHSRLSTCTGAHTVQQPRLVYIAAQVQVQALTQYSNLGQCTQQSRYMYRRSQYSNLGQCTQPPKYMCRRSHSTTTQVSVHSRLSACTRVFYKRNSCITYSGLFTNNTGRSLEYDLAGRNASYCYDHQGNGERYHIQYISPHHGPRPIFFSMFFFFEFVMQF